MFKKIKDDLRNDSRFRFRDFQLNKTGPKIYIKKKSSKIVFTIYFIVFLSSYFWSWNSTYVPYVIVVLFFVSLLCIIFVEYFSVSNFNNKKENFEKCNLSGNELKNLHLKNLDLILKFQKFCNENNLKWFLCGGGCIGAIRHKGFIPWDDDLDVFMHRKDYERLFKLKNIPKDFYITRTTENEFSSQTFTLITDKYSTLIKKEHLGLKIPRGVSIDVFPLDASPDSPLKRKIQMINACLFSLYITRFIPKKYGLLTKLLSRFLLFIVPSNKLKFKIASLCEKNMSKYKIEECIYLKELCAGPKYMKNLYDKKIFESQLMTNFEGYSLPIPIGYDSYLKTAFGNYMDLPPENERVNSHDIIFIDLKNPSEKYKNDF